MSESCAVCETPVQSERAYPVCENCVPRVQRMESEAPAFRRPCSPGCPGWGLFDEDSDPNIQRCDDCGRFRWDDGAANLVRKELA